MCRSPGTVLPLDWTEEFITVFVVPIREIQMIHWIELGICLVIVVEISESGECNGSG